MIPYDLRSDNKDAKEYYSDAELFQNEIIHYLDKEFHNDIQKMMAYIVKNNLEKLRSYEEYMFETVVIGVLWKNYIQFGTVFNKKHLNYFSRLKELRKNKLIKKYIDWLRGVLSQIILTKKAQKPVVPHINELSKLENWLDAAGEFDEEIIRIKQWNMYMQEAGDEESHRLLMKMISAAYYLETRGLERLGKYTSSYGKFIKTNKRRYFMREDRIFCMRRENEYFLNMLGAAVMNGAFKRQYQKTNDKVVLLPRCMSLGGGEKCSGTNMGMYIDCIQCSKECNVSKVKSEGLKQGFKIMVIPHSSNFTKTLEQWRDQDKTGVVGVACILNLLTGGFEMRKMGIPGQCVLLDFCGCKKHWDRNGIETSIDVEQLNKIIF